MCWVFEFKGKVKSYRHNKHSLINNLETVKKINSSYETFFDSKGNKLEVNYYDENGGSVFLEKYEYDDKGNVIKLSDYLEEELNSITVNKYDNQNNLLGRDVKIIKNDKNFQTQIEYKGIDSYEFRYVNKKKQFLEICKYNINEDIIEHINYDDFGNQVFKRVYEYNDFNNKVVTYYDYTLFHLKSSKHIFDKHIENYNDNGDIIELRTIKDNTNEELFLYEYKFDEKGNWIKQITYKDKIPISIAERKFEYFK